MRKKYSSDKYYPLNTDLDITININPSQLIIRTSCRGIVDIKAIPLSGMNELLHRGNHKQYLQKTFQIAADKVWEQFAWDHRAG